MVNIASLHRSAQTSLLKGPLSEHVDEYAARLKRGRYATNTVSLRLGAIAHFAHWMSLCSLRANQLDEGCIEQFLGYHLPRCNCPNEVVRDPTDLRAALVALLAQLRQQGIIKKLASASGPIADELRRYDAHMRDARGLATGTRQDGLIIVQRLLQTKFAGQDVVIGELRPEDIRRFMSEQRKLLSTTSHAGALAWALRAYFRYRASCGDAVQPLLAAISTPAHWGQASLPKGLTPEEVERLLGSFADALPSPRRGYAVVRLALDLGLRGGEIAQLQLADIDWRQGTLTLKHTKSGHQDVMPLPSMTGRALETYLRKERPKTSNHALFVRHLAPYDQPLGVDGIRRVVRDAFRRIGIQHGGMHALRHTLACQLVNRGSSIKEIADVLRHRSLNTSLIYAKVDYKALFEVALPWPGSAA